MISRAKFKCESVTHTINGGSIKLVPVTNTSEENSKFFRWTPYGSIEIGTINTDVIGNFIPGKEYYVDFTESN